MTDRFHSLTVVLEHDMREDDAESLLQAIRHLRGVLSVKGEVASPDTWMAESRARWDLRQKLTEVLK